jgi:hypothetical protein
MQAKDNEAKKISNEKRIRAISQELAEKMDGREGEGETERSERLQHIELLKKVRLGVLCCRVDIGNTTTNA